MYIILLTYRKPLENVEKYLSEHRAFLDSAYANGIFIMSGPKVPRTGGVIISSLNDPAKLDEVLGHDPFYIHKIAEYEIIEFNPNKYQAELSFLFK